MGAIVCLYHSYHGIGFGMAASQTSSSSSSLSPSLSLTTSCHVLSQIFILIANTLVNDIESIFLVLPIKGFYHLLRISLKLAKSIKPLTLVRPCGASRSLQISVTAIPYTMQCNAIPQYHDTKQYNDIIQDHYRNAAVKYNTAITQCSIVKLNRNECGSNFLLISNLILCNIQCGGTCTILDRNYCGSEFDCLLLLCTFIMHKVVQLTSCTM